MLPTRKALCDRIETLEADLATQTALLAEKDEENKSLTVDLAQANTALDEARSELDDANESITELTERVAGLQAEIDTFADQLESAADAKAASKLAQIGHDPIDDDGEDSLLSTSGDKQARFWERYNAIQDPAERTAYYREHAAAAGIRSLNPRARR